MALPALPHPDIILAGAGIIGLSLALKLQARGAQVLVLERDTALSHASTAAAGMLAARDEYNPSTLGELARYSLGLYPEYLAHVENLSGLAVPFQTGATLQYNADGSTTRIAEHSIDPRQLAAALLAAVRATSIELREGTGVARRENLSAGVAVMTANGERIEAAQFIVTGGAWSAQLAPQWQVKPMKGQMLRVRIPAGLDLHEVHRRDEIYIVPRRYGPQAGTALIGATVEDAGFETTVHTADLAHLRARASELIPALASEDDAPLIESWAGLRPSTPDGLPLIDATTATGHFRNGILLAPATAQVVADLWQGKQPAVDLTLFSPGRFE